MPKLPHKILTPALETRAVEIGAERYELTNETARQIIVEECAAAKVQRITSDKAQKHVAALVKQKVGDASWLDDQSKQLLYAAAVEWGYGEKEVDLLIKKRISANRMAQSGTSRLATWGIVGFCIAVAAAVAGLAIVMNGSSDPGDPPTDDGVTVDGGVASTDDATETGDPNEVAIPPKWWSIQMTIARGRLLVGIDDESPSIATHGRVSVFNQAASENPVERIKGYRELIKLANQTGAPIENRRAAARLLAQAFTFEPDEKSADALRCCAVGGNSRRRQSRPDRRPIRTSLLGRFHHG